MTMTTEPKFETAGVLFQVAAERRRQDEKWGQQEHTMPVWMLVLQEELGEAAQAMLQAQFELGEVNRIDRRVEQDHLTANCRAELIQSAAVIVAMIECGDRQGWWPR